MTETAPSPSALDLATPPAAEGTSTDVYAAARDPDLVSVPPDARPLAEQPQWRRDFAIDTPQEQYVARREFAKFMVLTSGAFVAGQAWIATQSLVRSNRPTPSRERVASLASLERGSVTTFNYPTEDDPCLLIRSDDGELVAFSQRCTHLSCAVIPRLDEGLLHCPCHEGYFDARTGANLAGPPPRPLPSIELEIDGDDVYAVAVHARMV